MLGARLTPVSVPAGVHFIQCRTRAAPRRPALQSDRGEVTSHQFNPEIKAASLP